jgi:hypothetical protein
MDTSKPYKGSITDWYVLPCLGGLGYYVRGTFKGHPEFDGMYGHTSYALSLDRATGELETRNSRYTLIGPESTAEDILKLRLAKNRGL